MREDHSTGKCVDIKDHKLIRFDLLHRPKTWQELNPGRPKRPSSKIAISVRSNDDKLKVSIYFYAVDNISYYSVRLLYERSKFMLINIITVYCEFTDQWR